MSIRRATAFLFGAAMLHCGSLSMHDGQHSYVWDGVTAERELPKYESLYGPNYILAPYVKRSEEETAAFGMPHPIPPPVQPEATPVPEASLTFPMALVFATCGAALSIGRRRASEND
jgi:hypothetical protein